MDTYIVCRLILAGIGDLDTSMSDVGLCSIVLELLSGIEDTHLKVYMDNYYTSPSLFLELYDRGVNARSTLRPIIGSLW